MGNIVLNIFRHISVVYACCGGIRKHCILMQVYNLIIYVCLYVLTFHFESVRYIYDIWATATENSHIILKPFRKKYYINIIII